MLRNNNCIPVQPSCDSCPTTLIKDRLFTLVLLLGRAAFCCQAMRHKAFVVYVFSGALTVVILFAIQYLPSGRYVLLSSFGNSFHGKVILYWQHYFDGDWNGWPKGDLQCGAAIKCRLTDSATEYTHSDALLFHGRGNLLKIPELSLRPSNQVWVYFNMESPVNIGEFDRTPNIINWTMTYIRGSDIHVSGDYGSVRPGTYMGGFDPNKNYLESKSKFAVAVISNCLAGYRMKVVNALANYTDLDLFGDCGLSKPLCPGNQSNEDCWEHMKDYKFYLSFENSACKDYVTEKFYRNALAHAVVPVVLGGANYSDVEIAPPGSYIDASKFSTVRELGEFLKKESSDQTFYNKYFRWHSNYTVFFQSLEAQLCSLCEQLHQSNYTTKSYKDVASWYSTAGKCVPYPQFSDALEPMGQFPNEYLEQ